ncbi:Protein CBR-IDA-1 [Caenorhabditis briggsae]|uniref:Protein CBR-IDA-1 n=1 Tax=Caenorhabditis briggsae TaxID=6238 RepID=A8X7T6_CAEBR|nr:Protein CBR-IDA-1 [Caenorhabditis briggsae]CAP28697.1 Protein CBR-IDA-1 [Caenorhabditis briggsae]
MRFFHFILLLLFSISTVPAFLLYGCNLSDNLCDNDESCYPDGVFGQCFSPESGSPEPTVLDNLDDTQLELLKLELTRLASKDRDWGDEETQCVLAYFKMSMFYQLQYDPDFCQVRKPANVWALIQLIDTGLSEDPSLLDEEAAQPENVTDEDMAQIIEQLKEPSLPTEEDIEEALNAENEDVDDEILDQYVQAVVNNENPDFSELSDAILKKDIEQVGEVNQGLDNTEHKIVKGRKDQVVTRVDANRVYLKVHLKNEDQLMPLIEFLQNTIAIPNNLYFDDFQFDNGQLSMRISRFEGAKPKAEKRIDSVEGVASAVYKRRKDIARLSGADVRETGIGSGEDGSLPVESSERDWLLMPVLFVCAFTVTALGLVAAVQIARSRRHYKDNIQQIAEQLDGKTSFAYQDLCRQRADGGRASKSSSTSSWCEETAAPTIDISTGHVVLNFLQEYLSEPTKIEAQWNGIKDYHNEERTKTKAEKFAAQNRTILPFDDNIVDIDGKTAENEEFYLNASFIYDDDPRQAVYIASQTPASNQVAAFWQTIWQHGVCLVVNLSTPEECKQEKNYWPDTGSEVHGAFEIHLVSEHIWSDDYLVRSFYLKNLQNSQTRTITQFHYLSWAKDSTPTSAKSILEFRRKVNKSYRGRSSAVLVHSWDGSGRTGVYCAVDVLCARLLRGIRQIDVVATVEHLRDQRDGMVATGDQFKLVYGCVAQEVNHLLKSIAAQ